MRLELIVLELTDEDLDFIVSRPTIDKYENDQLAGMEQFLEYVSKARPGGLTATAQAKYAELKAE